MDCWKILGIDETTDKREIRRAYAKLIKQNNPEDRPTEFQAIREAYDRALSVADYLTLEKTLEGESAESPQPSPRDPLATVDAAPTPVLGERDKLRLLQEERIDVSLATLIPLVKQDEVAAIDYCKAILKEEFFQALDVRYEFEGRLLQSLVQHDVFSMPFIEFVAKEFAWNIDVGRHWQMASGNFENDRQYFGAFRAVAHRYLTELVKRSVREKLVTLYTVTPEALDRLEGFLFSERPQEELETYCRSTENASLLRAACTFLTHRRFITPEYSFVPWDTLKVLIDKGIAKPPAYENPVPYHQPVDVESDSRMPRWLMAVIIIAVLRIAIYAIDGIHTDRKSEMTGYSESSEVQKAQERIDKSKQVEIDAYRGDVEAQYQVGMDYLRGGFIRRKDPEKALEWLNKAAAQKHTDAQETLGIVYYTGEAGVRDYPRAIELLTLADAKDRGEATFYLARAHDEGNGVAKDYVKARRLFERSSELGSSDGIRVMGMFYLVSKGADKNPKKGVEYLERAAGKDNFLAAYQLAHEYLNNEHLPLNYGEARSWFEFLANKNIPIGNLWLSQLYEKGLGVEQDSSQANRLVSGARQRSTPDTINQFSWELVTHKNKAIRNGPRAVSLMESLLANPSENTSARLDTLAAAYAEVGRFQDAMNAQNRAIGALPMNVDVAKRREYERHLQKFKDGKTVADNPN